MKIPALEALKRAATRTFDHYKGRIQEVNKQRRQKEQQAQFEMDVKNRPKQKDPNYITVPPPRRQGVMEVGKRMVKF